MRWIKRLLFGDSRMVPVAVGNYPGVVVISVDGHEALPSPAEARMVAAKINEAADRAEHRAEVWGITAGRLG
jgi:hypothetical protein